MIDNHTMTVIASDLVAIEPYEATVISIGMGQRYDIVVTADQTDATDFWMRAIPQSACSENDNEDDIRGIIYYGDSPGTPTTSAYDYEDSCSDETDNIVPYVSKTVGSTASTTADEPVAVPDLLRARRQPLPQPVRRAVGPRPHRGLRRGPARGARPGGW